MTLNERIEALEKVAHTPVDFAPYINKIRELEIRIARLEGQLNSEQKAFATVFNQQDE